MVYVMCTSLTNADSIAQAKLVHLDTPILEVPLSLVLKNRISLTYQQKVKLSHQTVLIWSPIVWIMTYRSFSHDITVPMQFELLLSELRMITKLEMFVVQGPLRHFHHVLLYSRPIRKLKWPMTMEAICWG